jgi:hypothetical protein
MAKVMKWTIDGSILSLEHVDSPVTLSQAFDATDIFPEFGKMTDVQQKVIVNGIKQKLADSVAVSKEEKMTPDERSASIAELWERLCAGEWNKVGTERVSINKKAAAMKDELSDDQIALLKKLGIKI